MPGREDLLNKAERLHRSHRLYGTHFDNKMFLNDMRNRLQPSAVLTNFPLTEGSSTFDHTYSAVVQNICLPRCPINEEVVKSSAMDIEKNVSIKHKPSTITVLQDITITPGNNIFHGEPEHVTTRPVTPSSTQVSQQLSINTPRKNVL
ncbi:uncharacterized protein [Diabrotica undecimpunctata]|uniref:uncharacterized protein n=1 Tax=Diabrotica undecimpunctata TaxID=50387 RepID=UPI003B63F9D7